MPLSLSFHEKLSDLETAPTSYVLETFVGIGSAALFMEGGGLFCYSFLVINLNWCMMGPLISTS